MHYTIVILNLSTPWYLHKKTNFYIQVIMSDLNEKDFMILGAEASEEDNDLLVGDDELDESKPTAKPKKEGEEDDWGIEEDLEEGLE